MTADQIGLFFGNMKTINSIRSMQRKARELCRRHTIALVPTMGYLHEGHLSLVKKARKAADVVVATIFVNPTQFGPGEDFQRYPRDEKGDRALLRDAGADYLFMPDAQQMYPDGYQTYVETEQLSQALEGAFRPGHFRGVTTVVSKLFNIVRPDAAVFGQKDFQQAVVLKRLVQDLDYPIKLIIAPTRREKDGLAMSSRNAYLGPGQRRQAICLYRGLRRARTLFAEGVTSAARLKKAVRKEILEVCPEAEIQYISFNDFHTLQPRTKVDKDTVCSVAAMVYDVRLIDNMRLG